MNFRLTSVLALSLAAAGAYAVETAGQQPILPGYLTDAGANWKDCATDGYRTPDHLKYPYIAMHYLRATLEAGAKQRVAYYVTDFDHSAWRFGDDSRRFDVQLRMSSDGGVTFTEAWKRDVPAADGCFDLGTPSVGEYWVGVRGIDKQNGLSSHTVWHRFRVVPKGSLEITEAETRRMAADDLKTYGLRNDGDYERIVPVEVGDPAQPDNGLDLKDSKDLTAKCLKAVDDYLAAHPHAAPTGRPGYAVYAAALGGVPIYGAYNRCRVVRDAGYDKAAVETIAEANARGLQKFIDDAKAAGKRKAVLLPGVYRVSKNHTLQLPDRFTLDLNGATLKLDGCTGCRALMVKIAAVTDSHLLNGTIEGDYWEHDYKSPESEHSEWVNGWSICGTAYYCSVENVTVRYITGYGGNNGLSSEGPGPLNRGKPFCVRAPFPGICSKDAPLVPGGLKADGTVDASDKYQWTSDYRPVSQYREFGYFTVSRFLGYQGVATRGWNYVVAFYDAQKKFLSREVAFQYRTVLLPKDAAFARFSVEVASEKEAQEVKMSTVLFKSPANCTVAHCVYDRCRAVGHAASHMSNFLFLENEFRYCGESLARCAFDAEDGWDGMQDVLFLRNTFHHNRNSEMLTCAGHNFQFIGNRGKIYLHPRTFSAFVKDNDLRGAYFPCGPRTRTGCARYINNNYRNGVGLGGDRPYDGWDVVLSGLVFTNGSCSATATGRFRDCTFRGVDAAVGNAENCTFEDCTAKLMRWKVGRWTNCTAKNFDFKSRQFCTNVFVDCTFRDCTFNSQLKSVSKFVNCDMAGTSFTPMSVEGCTFENCKNLGELPKPLKRKAPKKSKGKDAKIGR